MPSPLFDAWIVVDWSGAAVPRRGRDSIWYALLEPQGGGLAMTALENPATRHAALASLSTLLAGLRDRGRRTFVGFDFPNAYPSGFAAAAGFAGRPWRAVWDGIAGLIEDAADNASNRFHVAATLNRRIAGGGFPFWGLPTGVRIDGLGATRPAGYGDGRLPERRLCEHHVRSAQPCWKLFYNGSVGSQALTGIPVKRALRDDSRLGPDTRVWPFETGLGPPPADARIVLAEVYPSLWRDIRRPVLRDGEVKDAVQVRETARRIAERDAAGLLARDLAGPASLSGTERDLVVAEEGWILGAGSVGL